MSKRFPYARLPKEQLWKRAVADCPADQLDPQGSAKFRFDRAARIASAGSCFAQRIATRLRDQGYAYFVTEPGGAYSARYGDVYTTLQLAQLAQRATGAFVPAEPAWTKDGRFHDPFRPREPHDGFASVEELEAARATHLAAVRRLLVESDVFVFTLGLTETWCSRADGSAFPLCPGAGIGTFDDERYSFRNLGVDENVAALEEFLRLAWSLNPKLRVILTVSPVPLVATIEPHHVVQSSVYSKSVLRVAAETIRNRYEQVEYFASYEMIATPFAGIAGFKDDRREVRDDAVDRVMRSFFAAFTDAAPAAALPTIELTLDAVANVTPQSGDDDPCLEGYLERYVAER